MDNRRIAVDDDTWLPIPSGPAAVRIRGAEPVNVLTVLFRKGMPEEVLGTMLKEMSGRYVYFRPGDRPTLEFEKVDR